MRSPHENAGCHSGIKLRDGKILDICAANRKDMQNQEDLKDSENRENAPEQATTQPESGQEGNSTSGTAETQPAEPHKGKDELAEARDKYLRLYAEFENFRRRTSKERLDLIQTANEQLLKALLPVSDDFDRAEKSFKDLPGKESEGFFLILSKFRRVLEQQGLKPMDTSDGKFNPDLHEAITQVPMPDKSGMIIDVVEKGYLLNDKVIRHAKVVVGA